MNDIVRIMEKSLNSMPEARRLFVQAKSCYKAKNGIEGYKAGFELLKRASSLGHVGAHVWLGAAYDYGLGTRTNRRQAFKCYKFAADAGDPNAQYHIGVFYYDGIAVSKNYKTAVRWLKKAAQK